MNNNKKQKDRIWNEEIKKGGIIIIPPNKK